MTKIMYRRLHMKFTSHHSYMINNMICVNFLRFNATSIHFKIGCWHHNNHMKATVTLVNAPPLPNTGQLRHHNRRWCCSIVPSRSICSMSKWSLHSWLTLLGIHSCWNTFQIAPLSARAMGFTMHAQGDRCMSPCSRVCHSLVQPNVATWCGMSDVNFDTVMSRKIRKLAWIQDVGTWNSSMVPWSQQKHNHGRQAR